MISFVWVAVQVLVDVMLLPKIQHSGSLGLVLLGSFWCGGMWMGAKLVVRCMSPSVCGSAWFALDLYLVYTWLLGCLVNGGG